MKIGIFSSWLENLSLLKVLKQYNVDIVVYINQDCWPFEDKILSFQEKYVKKAIEILKNEKVDKIILHPLWELKFIENNLIFPLYKNLIDKTLKYSIVWKIGLFWNDIDLNEMEKFLYEYVKNYNLTERQKRIRKFNGFKFYKKDISVWKYNTVVLSKRNWMLRKLIKTDLRYFFDCGVDSILPTTYDVFNFEHIIKQKKKKLHFQSIDKWDFLDSFLWERGNKYSLKVIGEWNINMFLKHKKWKIWLK